MNRDRQRNSEGFSLIELLVAVAITFMIILYTTATFTFQQQTYLNVEQISETQQNSRAIGSLIERDIRNAGFMVPPAAAACGADADDGSDQLFLSDADAIRNIDELTSTLATGDLGADVSSIVSGTPDVVSVDDVVIDGQATYDIDADGTTDSDFQVGGGAILVDTANTDRGVRCGSITAIKTSTPQNVSVNFLNDFGAAATIGENLILVPAHAYIQSDGPPPQLRRNGQLMATNVEDLQVAYFYDDDEDGQVDAGEYRGTSTVDYDPSASVGENLREIRFNLILRTGSDDLHRPNNAGTGQQTENRDTDIAGDDGRRRRLHTTTVRLRNIQAD
ncbi:MAG: PilW family protein [Deltaproteobacteria bacterium]|nr:PilW family protein [Deltaproteobacteria bacterium]MBW2666614.1 PilW family protein [Deltaproteobacteria bacterium]